MERRPVPLFIGGSMYMSYRRFGDLSVSEKLVDSFFIVFIGIGYLFAMALIFMDVAPLDGDPGLSVKDIELKYYGNRSGTRLEEVLKGPMKIYHSSAEHEEIVAWIYAGIPEPRYREKIKPIFDKRCVACHNPSSGMTIPDLTDYEKVKAFATGDTGISVGALARVSHIHLFGVTMVFYLLGRIFILVEMQVWLKRTIVAVPFTAIVVDIGSWWLTRYIPAFSYAVLIGGALMGVSLAVQSLVSLYQMWFYRPKGAD